MTSLARSRCPRQCLCKHPLPAHPRARPEGALAAPPDALARHACSHPKPNPSGPQCMLSHQLSLLRSSSLLTTSSSPLDAPPLQPPAASPLPTAACAQAALRERSCSPPAALPAPSPPAARRRLRLAPISRAARAGSKAAASDRGLLPEAVVAYGRGLLPTAPDRGLLPQAAAPDAAASRLRKPPPAHSTARAHARSARLGGWDARVDVRREHLRLRRRLHAE
mmetsp:Transcript_54551/g.150249  ORF Transcript_54551/g.150249 Transcript_54551/m.150249 type:complete len:223 (+) Transcript_54551:252-920(+)